MTTTFKRSHGITMVAGAYIENLNLEPLAADPAILRAGRLWYNTTDKLIKFSGLDSEGQLVARIMGDSGDVASVQSQLDELKADDTTMGSVAYQVKQAVEGLLGGATPEALDTLNEFAAAIGNDENFAASVTTQIATAKAAVEADVTEDINTVNTSIGDISTKLTALISSVGAEAAGTLSARSGTSYLDGVGNVYAEVLALDTALAAVTGRVSTLENNVGTMSALTTTNKTSLVAAINEVKSASALAVTGVRTDINAKKQMYLSSENGGANTTHAFTHGIIGDNVVIDVKTVSGNNRRYDDYLVSNDATTGVVTVYAAESINVVIIVEDKSDI